MRWSTGYLALWTACVAVLGVSIFPLLPKPLNISNLLDVLPHPSKQTFSIYVLYVVFLAILGGLLPGRVVPGVLLPDGYTRLKYKCNGLLLTGVTVFTIGTLVSNKLLPGAWIADNYGTLFATSNIFSLGLSLYLFVVGRLTRPKNWLKTRGVVEDFIMGAELNPHILSLDVKFFSYRPSMMGWLLVNLSFLYKQYETLGYVTNRMLLYQGLTGWYVVDYFYHETKMTSTWDIIAENFGFMLVWGNYSFIPFAFSIQNLFLVDDVRPVTKFGIWVIWCTFCTGFAIFRGANSQKHQFKTDPRRPIWGKPPVALGGKLLASGYWGMARHMNYAGDLLLALSFCLPCGFSSAIPYFYFIYLFLLVVHREKRDDDRCSAKYGSLWADYCCRVRYRMVPYIY